MEEGKKMEEGVGGQVGEVEGGKEGVGEIGACDENGGWEDDEGYGVGLDGRVGEMGEDEGQEKEDCPLLEEADAGGGMGPHGCGDANGGSKGVEE